MRIVKINEKRFKATPFFVIGLLKDAFQYYKEENVRKEDWGNVDIMYRELLYAYHKSIGLK
mgnify:FL=1